MAGVLPVGTVLFLVNSVEQFVLVGCCLPMIVGTMKTMGGKSDQGRLLCLSPYSIKRLRHGAIRLRGQNWDPLEM